jgi:hypothetical protein
MPARKSLANPLPPVAEAEYGPYAAIMSDFAEISVGGRPKSVIRTIYGCHIDGVVRNPHDCAENERCYPVNMWRSKTVRASQQPEGGRRKQVPCTHDVQANPKSPIERHGAYHSHRKISPGSPLTQPAHNSQCRGASTDASRAVEH